MLFYSVSKGVSWNQDVWEEIMKPDQRWSVIHYLRTFSKGEDKRINQYGRSIETEFLNYNN